VGKTSECAARGEDGGGTLNDGWTDAATIATRRVNEHDRSLLSERSPRRARPRSTDDRRVDRRPARSSRSETADDDRAMTRTSNIFSYILALSSNRPSRYSSCARSCAHRDADPRSSSRRSASPSVASSTSSASATRPARYIEYAHSNVSPPRTSAGASSTHWIASSCRASSLSATTAHRVASGSPGARLRIDSEIRSAFLCAPRDVASRRREKRSSRDASTDSAAAALSGAGGFPPPNMTSASATRSGDGRREGFIRPLDASTRSCP